MANSPHRRNNAERADLIRALSLVQNHPFYRSQDILTITGCGMTNAQVREHLDSCIRSIGAFWSIQP